MANLLFGLRVWMAFITLVNLSIVITFHAWLIPYTNSRRDDEMIPYQHSLHNYVTSIASPILFLAYLYSIWGQPRLHKFLRAPLMLLPALFMIAAMLQYIHRMVQFAEMVNEQRPPEHKVVPFICYGESITAICAISQSYTFIPIIVGFFVIIEVFVTLLRGPLYPSKKVDF
ncbi:MAG: hypothetical protein J3R72DRAFT_429145 [Linnemannia gamsii]|nr:MAG: hypothetical protein J3R72DRAFT_429145 [Linnemannia gamsii]